MREAPPPLAAAGGVRDLSGPLHSFPWRVPETSGQGRAHEPIPAGLHAVEAPKPTPVEPLAPLQTLSWSRRSLGICVPAGD